MPADQRGWVRKRKNGWQACWRVGGSSARGPHLFESKTDAKRWLEENIRGGRARLPDRLTSPGESVTFAEHVERYLRVHAATVDPSTIRTLRDRLGATLEDRRKRRSYRTALETFGHVTLAELELMSLEIADWQGHSRRATATGSSARSGRCCPRPSAGSSSTRTRPTRPARTRTQGGRGRVLRVARRGRAWPTSSGRLRTDREFGVETGLRPSEWAPSSGADETAVPGSSGRQFRRGGRLKEYGKTAGSRRDVPLPARALAAVDDCCLGSRRRFCSRPRGAEHRPR